MADPLTVFSVRGGVVEKFGDPNALTYTVDTAETATGGLLTAAKSGDRLIETAGAGSRRCQGVALYDAAAGETVSVARSGTWMLRASENITAGDRVKCAANGEVAVLDAADDPDLLIGRAEANITSGADGPITLLIGA